MTPRRVRLSPQEWASVLSDAKRLDGPFANGSGYTSIGEMRDRREDTLRATVERIVADHVAPWRQIAEDAEHRTQA